MKICGIYKITSPSKKIYIGQSADILKRIKCYEKGYCKNQKILFYSLKKYGWKKHKFEIICQCDESELNNLEKYYVDLYGTFNSEYGMNIKDGGGSRGKCSEDMKKRMSIAQKGKTSKRIGYKHSELTKQKIRLGNQGRKHTAQSRKNMSLAHIGKQAGENHFRFGKHCSEETKEKIRKKLKGIKLTDEVKQKISEGMKKYCSSADVIKNRSERMKGNKYNLGKKRK